jgi:transcription elongation factor GreA
MKYTTGMVFYKFVFFNTLDFRLHCRWFYDIFKGTSAGDPQKGNLSIWSGFLSFKYKCDTIQGGCPHWADRSTITREKDKMATSFLTREGFEKLQEELEILRTQRRQEIAERLHEAMEGGELIENAEYEAAKNEQAFVEGRIKELEVLLATARVVEETPLADTVQVGTTVVIREEGSSVDETYTIVGAAEADPGAGKISNESPLGRALINRKAGDKVQVDAPAGSFMVSIIKVE